MFLRPRPNLVLGLILLIAAVWAPEGRAQEVDPLPSWNDGPVKTSIIEFVARVTDEAGPGFVRPEERIATFDNDGTLWVEQPIYTQLVFMEDEAKRLSAAHPEWQDNSDIKALMDGNFQHVLGLGPAGFADLLATTHAGETAEEFDARVNDWIDSAIHPRFNQLYLDLVYLPQIELMDYLRDNDFKVFIVSAGSIAFMRAWADETYGVAPPNVVGTNIETSFSFSQDYGEIVRESKAGFVTDAAGKAEGIDLHIGQRPIFAFGNSGGDKEMLEYTRSGSGDRMALIVYHDDAEREYAYGPAGGLPNTGIGVFTQALMDQAKSDGWHVVSMKEDWKRIFAFEEAESTAGDAE
ncbi:HAD family hydrolase [Bauldia sp.]|uniref:HAD family hydrolase n=1 Tax=Bauldia sp. TaxID=2575872 RepID=UPI003BAC9E54